MEKLLLKLEKLKGVLEVSKVLNSTLELQEVVQKELLENPLLEEVTPETADAPESGDGTTAADAAPVVEPPPPEPPPANPATPN